MTTNPRILVLTVAIGADYRLNLKKALDSKRDYCKRHGYEYLELHEEVWDRDRPIAWSKVPQFIKYASMTDKYDYIWVSDADVWITNPSLRLEDHILPLLPSNKNLLLTYDTCHHVNSGNMILRPSKWVVDYFTKVWNKTDDMYHIWWENGAMCKIMSEDHESCAANIEVTMEAYKFNAYLMGFKGTRMWQPGDFLVHFAGIYDPKKMVELMNEMEAGKVPRLSMF